jgi:hypothetical protein
MEQLPGTLLTKCSATAFRQNWGSVTVNTSP